MSELTFIGGLGTVAQQYGLDEAVLLHSCVYWWREHKAKRENYRDGRFWNHCTMGAFAELMPWWSARQVRYLVESCRKKGALLTANYNDNPKNKVLWYCPSDELLAMYGEAEGVRQNCHTQDGECDKIVAVRESECDKIVNECDKIVAVPNNRNTCNNTCNIPPVSPPEIKKALDDYASGDKELREALDGLAENRARMKKPIKSLRAVQLLLAALDKLSGGDREIKIAMLDKAVRCNWLSVYALNDRDREDIAQARAAPRDAPAERFLGIQVIDGEEVAVYG